MSDTPRTDDQIGYKGTTMTLIDINFARQLERELAATQAEAARLRAVADGLAGALGACTFKDWFNSNTTGFMVVHLDADAVRSAIAAYQATK